MPPACKFSSGQARAVAVTPLRGSVFTTYHGLAHYQHAAARNNGAAHLPFPHRTVIHTTVLPIHAGLPAFTRCTPLHLRSLTVRFSGPRLSLHWIVARHTGCALHTLRFPTHRVALCIYCHPVLHAALPAAACRCHHSCYAPLRLPLFAGFTARSLRSRTVTLIAFGSMDLVWMVCRCCLYYFSCQSSFPTRCAVR